MAPQQHYQSSRKPHIWISVVLSSIVGPLFLQVSPIAILFSPFFFFFFKFCETHGSHSPCVLRIHSSPHQTANTLIIPTVHLFVLNADTHLQVMCYSSQGFQVSHQTPPASLRGTSSFCHCAFDQKCEVAWKITLSIACRRSRTLPLITVGLPDIACLCALVLTVIMSIQTLINIIGW